MYFLVNLKTINQLFMKPNQLTMKQPNNSRNWEKFKTLPQILLLAILLFSTQVFATHFRYGSVTATRISETVNQVTYRLNVVTAWRLTQAPSSVPFTFSGGNSGNVSVPMTNVTDPSGGWTNSTGSAVIILNKTATPTTIRYTNGDKISTIVNNHDAFWDVYMVLFTNKPGSTPVSTLPAIINMPIGAAAATYTIPATDPDAGSSLTYGLPAFTGNLSGQTEPPGFSLNSATGQITLNTLGKTLGQQYNALVTVTDNDGNQILLDFLINMVGVSTPPVFNYAVTPANGAIYNVIAGQTITFPISASDQDAGSSVSMSVSGLNAAITTSNFSNVSLPALGNPSITTFSWTPGIAQVGTTNVLNFIASDNVGVQTTTSVTIRVVAEPAPVFAPPTPLIGSIRQIETGELFTDVIVAQSPLNSNVSIAFATGIPSGAALSPTVPSAGANPGTTTLSWTPQPSDFGVKNISFQATIAAFPTIFTTTNYQLIVNTTPQFTSTPIESIVAGHLYTYNVTVNDPDVPFGDIVDVIAGTLPSWLTLINNGDGTATLTGIPTLADIGEYDIELEAEDMYHHGNIQHVHQHFDITVNSPAVITPSNSNSNTICLYDPFSSYTLNANTGVGLTYQWFINNQPINGGTADSYSPTFSGSYTVLVTSNGISSMSNAIEVIVNSPPRFFSPQNITVFTNASGCTATAVYAPSISASPMASLKYTYSGATTGFGDGTGSSGSFNIGVTTVTITAMNVCGISTCTFTVTVEDNIAPTVMTQDVTVPLNANGSASITANDINNGSSDNCTIASVTVSPSEFSCANIGNNVVTLTVTDINGNVSYGTANVTVQDVTAPIVITRNVHVTLNPNGRVTIGLPPLGSHSTGGGPIIPPGHGTGGPVITVVNINNGSSDACGIQSISVSPTTFTCADIGANTVTLTVTDVNGNVSTGTATVTVNGVVPSCSITSSASGTVIGSTTTLAAANQMYLGYGQQSMTLTCTANGAAPFTYSWTGSGLNSNTVANPVFTPTAGGNYTFVCTVTNAYGCQTTCSITICVLDIRVAGGSANNQKVYLCHLPAGNPANAQTLSISINAVPAHLGNHGGDKLGSCGMVCGFSKGDVTTGEIITEEVTDGQVDLIVYPNPSQNIFKIELESGSQEVVQITVYDLSGKVVLDLKDQKAGETITIDQLTQAGVYIAEVKQGEFHKFVKLNRIN